MCLYFLSIPEILVITQVDEIPTHQQGPVYPVVNT